MKDFRSAWKDLANSKAIKSSDMFMFAVLRAQNIKTEITYEGRVAAAFGMTKAAFTPISNYNKLHCSSMDDPYFNLHRTTHIWFLQNCNMWNCLETEEEKELFSRLTKDVLAKFTKKVRDKEKESYNFVFVRTNL